jgi:hypothetical protein
MKRHARSLVKAIEENCETNAPFFGAEVGVWKGELSADLLEYFPNLSLLMVDMWQAEDEAKSMHAKDSSQEAMDLAMNEAAMNTEFAVGRREMMKAGSVEAADRCCPGFFDFVFLDADHFYESVRADLLAWFTTIKHGGIFAGHDYDGRGDRRKGWGVKRAVTEFFGTLKLEVNVEPGLVWWVKKW